MSTNAVSIREMYPVWIGTDYVITNWHPAGPALTRYSRTTLKRCATCRCCSSRGAHSETSKQE